MCESCGKPKANFSCCLCESKTCKNCTVFLKENTFDFYSTVPEELTHPHYCGRCYDSVVAPALEEYEALKEAAKNVFVFFVSRKKEIPLIRKGKEVFKVPACPDRDETIFRLGFFAAQAGYNAIIEVDVKAKKVRDGSYQTSVWSGTAVPADINEGKLEKQELANRIYT